MLKKLKLWGSATVGSKGQLVIPAEARAALDIKEGEKLLVISPPNSEAIMIVRHDVLEKYIQRVQTNINDLQHSNSNIEE